MTTESPRQTRRARIPTRLAIGADVSEPIGNLLDSLGLDLDLDDDELVAGAIVLLKTIDADGEVGLRIRWSDGMGYIERLGMLVAGQAVETVNLGHNEDGE